VPCLHEVLRHGLAHRAQADESDTHDPSDSVVTSPRPRPTSSG
jgi:hypothetical protein